MQTDCALAEPVLTSKAGEWARLDDRKATTEEQDQFRRSIPQRGMQRPGRAGKRGAHAVHEDARLELLGDAGVHHRAVPPLLNVRPEALEGSAPAHLAHLGGRQHPARVPVKRRPEVADHRGVHEVQEGVAETRLPLEVNGQVHEVVLPGEALCVKHLEEHLARVVVRQVPQHDRGALVCRLLTAGLGCRLHLARVLLRAVAGRRSTVPHGGALVVAVRGVRVLGGGVDVANVTEAASLVFVVGRVRGGLAVRRSGP
mmetsp:Transcript_30473/g.77586  ORF Transcript_30473/g.77586 Transcript_30473/m.77586 type:complete len:257 (-) Transcript_30473:251-1021(-)